MAKRKVFPFPLLFVSLGMFQILQIDSTLPQWIPRWTIPFAYIIGIIASFTATVWFIIFLIEKFQSRAKASFTPDMSMTSELLADMKSGQSISDYSVKIFARIRHLGGEPESFDSLCIYAKRNDKFFVHYIGLENHKVLTVTNENPAAEYDFGDIAPILNGDVFIEASLQTLRGKRYFPYSFIKHNKQLKDLERRHKRKLFLKKWFKKRLIPPYEI